MEQHRTPGASKQHKFETSVSFWHDGVPDPEHEEVSKGECWKKLDWSKNRVAKATPIKVEKSRDLNIGSNLKAQSIKEKAKREVTLHCRWSRTYTKSEDLRFSI